jgi:hypothetical protein
LVFCNGFGPGLGSVRLELYKKTENEYLRYHTNINVAATAKIIEDTSADRVGHQFYSLLPLEDKKEFNIKLLPSYQTPSNATSVTTEDNTPLAT